MLRLQGVTVDARDPLGLARFWAGVLGGDLLEPTVGEAVVQGRDEPAYRLVLCRNETPKVGQNRIHLDLTSSSQEEMTATVARALALGGRHLDIGQTPADGHVVLADPEGNELCVIEPGNSFLADTGAIGAINCDGSREAGYFWSRALGWPLVWDQDEETAIQAPTGGSKVTWSGPPLMPRHGRDRLRLALEVGADGDAAAELDRLVSLGARRLGPDEQSRSGRVELSDPDGTVFTVALS